MYATFMVRTMPKTVKEKATRKNIRIPTPMIGEIDRIVDDNRELGYNRQQFIEAAIREKIERIRMMETQAKAEAPLSDE